MYFFISLNEIQRLDFLSYCMCYLSKFFFILVNNSAIKYSGPRQENATITDWLLLEFCRFPRLHTNVPGSLTGEIAGWSVFVHVDH